VLLCIYFCFFFCFFDFLTNKSFSKCRVQSTNTRTKYKYTYKVQIHVLYRKEFIIIISLKLPGIQNYLSTVCTYSIYVFNYRRIHLTCSKRTSYNYQNNTKLNKPQLDKPIIERPIHNQIDESILLKV